MTRPTETEYEAWIEECVAHLQDAESYDVVRAHANEFLLLYGVIARTMRFADAYLHLIRAGYGSEGVVLARAALEYAVTLQWIIVVNGGIDRYRVTSAHDRQEHYSNLAKWLNNEELAEEVKKLDLPPAGKRLLPFTNMLRDLDKENFPEMSYHILAQQVHVTHSAVTSFVSPGEDELHIKYDQDYGYQFEASNVVAASCMFARWAVARLKNDNTLLERLDKSSDDLILPMTLLDSVAPNEQRKGLRTRVTGHARQRLLVASHYARTLRLRPRPRLRT